MRFVSGPARTGWLLVFAFACASGGCEDDEHCSAPLVCADEGCKSFVDRVGTARFGFRTFAVYGCGQYTVVADRQGGEGGVRHFFYSDAETLAGVFYDGAGVAADFRDWLDDRDVDTEKMQGCNAIWEGEEVECVPTCAHSGYGGLAEQLGLDPCEEDGPDECRLPKLCPCDTYEERLASLEAQSRGQHCSQEGECYASRPEITGWREYACADGRVVLARFGGAVSYHFYGAEGALLARASAGPLDRTCPTGLVWEGSTPPCEACVVAGEGRAADYWVYPSDRPAVSLAQPCARPTECERGPAAFVGARATCGRGTCPADRTYCVLGEEMVACEPGPPAASDPTCDQLDDDCDGQVDDDTDCGCAGRLVGDEGCFCDGEMEPPCNGCPTAAACPAPTTTTAPRNRSASVTTSSAAPCHSNSRARRANVATSP